MIETVCSDRTKAGQIEARLIALIHQNPFAHTNVYTEALGVGAWNVSDLYKRWRRKFGKITPLWIIRKKFIDDCAAAHPEFSTAEIANELKTTKTLVGTTYRKFESKRQTSDRLRRDRERQNELRRLKRSERREELGTSTRYLYARNPAKWREIVEKTKAELKKHPFKTLETIMKETGASESMLNKAREELEDEGWFRDLEREILLEEYAEARPNANLFDAAEHFGADPNVIYRTPGSWRLNPSSTRWNTQPDLGYNKSVEDYELEQRVVIPPEWYVCEIERRGALGVKLPPDQFARYLELYERRKRLGPSKVSLESEGIVVK